MLNFKLNCSLSWSSKKEGWRDLWRNQNTGLGHIQRLYVCLQCYLPSSHLSKDNKSHICKKSDGWQHALCFYVCFCIFVLLTIPCLQKKTYLEEKVEGKYAMHLHTKETKRVLAELILGLLYKPYMYLPKRHSNWYWGLGMQESSLEFNPTHFFHVFIASLASTAVENEGHNDT